ncbi:MAG: M28 family peptidase [Gemmatimonadales bacterium]
MFESLAVPRLSGSAPLDAARETVAQLLRSWGYSVTLQEFTASERRLHAVSTGGAGLGWWALIVGPLLVLPLPGWPVALIGIGALGVVGLLAVGVAAGHLPSGAVEARGANLIALRGESRLWLVAHLDSKAQRFSLATRTGAATAVVLGGGLLAGLLLLRLFTSVPWWLVIPAVVLSSVAGAVLSTSGPTNRSPGAVDNATGVVAALAAARALRERSDVGVLITDAEELGMEGARAWASSANASWTFVNFDGIDDRGRFIVVPHVPRGPGGRRSRDLVEKLVAGLRAKGAPAAVGRLPPGVLVDGTVLAMVGLPGVTVCRGDWHTLRVVHTPQDSPSRVSLESALLAGEVAAVTFGGGLG